MLHIDIVMCFIYNINNVMAISRAVSLRNRFNIGMSNDFTLITSPVVAELVLSESTSLDVRAVQFY